MNSTHNYSIADPDRVQLDKDVATNYESHCTCQILADYLINIAKQAFYKSRKDYLAICVIIHPSHHLGC